jgi:hypothetical protein
LGAGERARGSERFPREAELPEGNKPPRYLSASLRRTSAMVLIHHSEQCQIIRRWRRLAVLSASRREMSSFAKPTEGSLRLRVAPAEAGGGGWIGRPAAGGFALALRAPHLRFAPSNHRDGSNPSSGALPDPARAPRCSLLREGNVPLRRAFGG